MILEGNHLIRRLASGSILLAAATVILFSLWHSRAVANTSPAPLKIDLHSTPEAHPAPIRFAASDQQTVIPVAGSEELAAFESSKTRMFFLGIYYGVILAMMLYNLFLFLYLRDRSYLWFSLHISLMAVYFLGQNSMPLAALAGFQHLQGHIAMVFLGLGIIAYTQFSRLFLMTAGSMHRFDKALKTGMGVFLVLTLLSPLADADSLRLLFTLSGFTVALILMGAGIRAWWRNYTPARFFVFGVLLVVMGGAAATMADFGFAPATPIMVYGFQIGSALEAVFLSFALADRVTALRIEHDLARRGERRYMTLAITDSLTGLYNSRFFRSRLKSELVLTEQMKLPLALVLIDVDDFKKYNDTWGHLEGDQVLIRLGSVIRANIRNADTPCRYGGEEFAVILPGSTAREANEIAGRIRRAVESEVFSPGGNGLVTITISSGIAGHVKGQPHHLLIDRTDQALYRAKTLGKNKNIMAE